MIRYNFLINLVRKIMMEIIIIIKKNIRWKVRTGDFKPNEAV